MGVRGGYHSPWPWDTAIKHDPCLAVCGLVFQSLCGREHACVCVFLCLCVCTCLDVYVCGLYVVCEREREDGRDERRRETKILC